MSESDNRKKEILPELLDNEESFVLYSAVTACPYILCDQETRDDEIFLFFTESGARTECAKLKNEGIPTRIVRLGKDDLSAFYSSLYTLGVNAVMVETEQGRVRFQLEEIMKRKDSISGRGGGKWVENPQLHLTAIYLMQGMRTRQGKNMEKEQRELLEEMMVHFAKGRFIQPMRIGEGKVPLLRHPKGEKYQPIFTDILEFQKFCKNNEFQPLIVEAARIPKILSSEAAGVVINPLGVNLPLQIKKKREA